LLHRNKLKRKKGKGRGGWFFNICPKLGGNLME